MSITGLILIIIMFVGSIWIIKRWLNFNKTGQENAISIENFLSEQNFTVSRKVCGHKGFFLYVDDINKKWLLTSPQLPQIGKIRDYADLIDYDFFDVDSVNWGQIVAGSFTVVSAITGGLLFGSLGAIAGGYGTAKATKILFGTEGDSAGYGLTLKIADTDSPSPILNAKDFYYDFYNVFYLWRKYENQGDKAIEMLSNPFSRSMSKVRWQERSSGIYQRDIAVIKEMAECLDYILTSNANR
jgi:hypothetical protein